VKYHDFEITGVTDDTREVAEGYAFAAVKGGNFDGEAAAAEMLRKGAAVVITENDLGIDKHKQVIVPDTRAEYAEIAKKFYGSPTDKLKLIGVTGTNGKSTTAHLIRQILNGLGHKTGLIGTIEYDVCDGSPKEARLTTPRQNELYSLFAEMVKNGAEYCVIEASSQALSQSRFAREKFLCGIFTNLTRDHIDWHKTTENYYKAKKSLFAMCENAVICIDDKYGVRLCKELKKERNINVKTYSVGAAADYYGVNVKTASTGVSYWLSDAACEKSYPLKIRMPGLFNAANSIAAAAACNTAGFDLADCVRILDGCEGAKGRGEIVYDGEFTVICDYAHTEDALIKILTSAREYAKKRIICVFGAAGERDAVKRPAMGASAARLADYLVITSDNPRFEDPAVIISQVEDGCKNSAAPYRTFIDRREAIAHALGEAEKGDIVLLCGKGHETYQVIGDEYQPFNERDIVAEIMGGRNF